jgi:chemotaxis protein methyltransferase CheR
MDFNFSVNQYRYVQPPNVSKLPEMSQIQFEQWRKFIYDKTGIYFQDNKKYLLESRLLKRIVHLKISSYDEYLKLLSNSVHSKNEMRYFYDTITINETFFFRNTGQLDAMVQKVVPEILQNKQNTGKHKIRIWSAACSSGEEAYSVAIMLNEFIKPKFPEVTFEIVGTDINQTVLDTAVRGIYGDYAIRNMPIQYLKKYFKQIDGMYELNLDIKTMATFKNANLFDSNDMLYMNNFDIIFCANVLIYFDNNSKIKVVNQLYKSLNKGGYLFIGFSETLHGISKAFSVVSFPKTVGYKKE